MKSRNKKRLLALVLCMVVAISNSSFIFASETGQAEYPQEAEVQTQDEAVANDMDVAAYAADEGQAVADEQPAAVEQVAAEPAAEPETTAENQAAQPVAEAPAAEQPTTEAPAAEASAAQAPAAAPTEEIAPASENATAETPEEDATQVEAENQQLTWSQAVGNTTVNVTAEAGALPADAQLSVTEITAEDEVKEIEKAVEEKAIEEQFSIKNIFSYDIKFLVNGSEVQPTTPVQVSVDTPEITSSQDAAVMHVDDNNVAEDMKSAVDGEGKVVFDAPHFSTYVIIQKGDSSVKLTIQHYDGTQETDTKIYADDERTLPVGGKINDYTKAVNWTVTKVVQVDGDNTEKTFETEKEISEISVTKDCTLKVYYEPKHVEGVSGSTTFYDYTVKAGQSNGNYWSDDGYTYYSFNMLSNPLSPTTDNKLTAGTNSDQNYSDYQQAVTVNGKNANAWTGKGGGAVTGLVNGLNSDGEVIFNYPEPGFFVDSDYSVTFGEETRYLRKVYKDYTLFFEQTGDTYELKSVKDSAGNSVATKGEDFFPLDNVLPSYESGFKRKTQSSLTDDGKNHNYFFGMRYDVNFKIGDYVGPLNYTFTGDDDLWVLLDGEEVVIDLGGIHDKITSSVDLWKYIGTNLSSEDKQKEHTLTILYMERGAGASDCEMKFTLPSARISEVTSAPMTELVLQKVNSKDEKLTGARFTLTNNATGEKQVVETAGSEGLAQFTKLKVGEYTLTEDVAPSGYIPSIDSWIVKVELNKEGKAVATMYLSNGSTKYTQKSGSYYQILNLTEQESVNSSLDYTKTAHVTNWNERTYEINITASSKLTSSSIVEKDAVADIVFALDVSGSMDWGVGTKSDAEAVYKGQFKNTELDTSKIYYVGQAKTYYSMIYYPMIYQNGNWIYYSSNTWKNVTNNSMIYTIDSRLSGLKEAATAFIASAGVSSKNSRIGVVSFSTTATNEADMTTVDTSGTAALIKTVNKLNADGGTSPDTALSNAAKILSDSKRKDVPQYVILFTDGEPTGNSSSWKDDYAYKAKLEAEKLKEAGIIVYTVGLGLTEKAKGWLDGTKKMYDGSKRLISGIASDGCAYTADNIEQLKDILKKIQQTTTQNLDISGAEIKDIIDPRFVILDKNGKPITQDYEGIENGVPVNGGMVYYDNQGNQYIVWTNQTIPNKEKGTWTKTINVKAREDYIGGNNVATNIYPDSKISTGYGDAILPQPTVNVKAELDIGDKEITIYKGDSLPATDKILQEMFDLSGNVNRYNVSEDDFHITWYDESGNEIDMSALDAETGGNYHLKVTYDAGTPTTESTANTDDHVAGDRTTHLVPATKKKADGTDERDYGIYTIHVISGEIKLTKELETALTEDKEFVFNVKVTKPDKTVENIEVPITVLAGTTKAMYSGDLLKDLARGTYTITENVPDGYVLTDYAIDNDNQKTNCENLDDAEKESVTFKLGYEKGKTDADVIKNYMYTTSDGGTIGTASFTNEKATTNWDIVKVSTSGTDVHLQGAEFELQDSKNNIVYTGVSDEDGKIIWKKGNNPVTELEKGTYTLVEKKAPLGYVLSTEKWTITVTKNGSLVAVTTDKTGQEIKKSTISVEDATLHLYFKNDVVYDLPSTGHTGIFNILMSGILLMFAGILIIYKMKGKGVLKK